MTPQGLRLHAVDLDRQLRDVGAERRQHQLDGRLRLGVLDDRVGDALQLGQVEAAVAQLDLHGEAGVVADALDRRRRHHQDARLLDRAEGGVEALEERKQVLAFAALAPVLEDDVGDAGAGQRRAVVERRHAGDGDHLVDARRLAGDLVDLVERLLRALRARRRRATARARSGSPGPRSAGSRSAPARSRSRRRR